jgi:hypothetical protein
MNKLVDLIKNMPPMLKEEIIGRSMEAIEKDAEQKVMKEIRKSAAIVTEDITELIIKSRKTGQPWQRPDYTNDINDKLYHTFVDIAEQFVNNNAEKLIFSSNLYGI